MTTPEVKIKASSIVLIGDFNPKIFQPAWFAAEELIRKQEAEEASIEIIRPEVVSFTLEWLKMIVTHDRFQTSTTQKPYYDIMRDLVIGTFELLQHTPIRMMGINTEIHYQMKDEDEWHSLGHRLAPKELWDTTLNKPGMQSLTMKGERSDGFKGYIQVVVEPSAKVYPGIYFNVNDHYEVKDPESVIGCEEILSILESSWKESIERSQKIIESILEA